ncbi:MAG: LacI family DNA-binding transcriptional regulator [Actinomycetota bacterium]
MQKLTIYEIAKIAGVSPKTVSRVINNEPNVAKKTLEKVMHVIEENNYFPNVSAQRLVSKKVKTMGLIVPRIGSPYATQLVSVILNRCKFYGYTCIVYPYKYDSNNNVLLKDYQNIIGLYLKGHVSGLIIAPPGGDDDFFLEYISNNNIPTVLITPNAPYKKEFFIIKATDKKGGYQATEYLVGLGHKRIAIITCDLKRTFSIERLEGYKEALKENNISIFKDLVVEGNNSFLSGFSAAKQLINKKNSPTAIFACNDEMALGVESAIWKMGLKIPDDISIVGFDDIPLVSELPIPLTSIRQPVEKIGDIAVNTLIKLVNLEQVDKKIYEIPTELVIRSSCKKK